MVDANDPSEQIEAQLQSIPVGEGQQIALILNKSDKATEEQIALSKKTTAKKRHSCFVYFSQAKRQLTSTNVIAVRFRSCR